MGYKRGAHVHVRKHVPVRTYQCELEGPAIKARVPA